MTIKDAWVILRWIWRTDNTAEDDQTVRVAVNRMRQDRGQAPLTRAEFEQDDETVRAKMAENGNSFRGRWRTMRWAATGKDAPTSRKDHRTGDST
jgi:hypothetical protein